MRQDTENYVRKCDWCQKYALIPHMSSEVLNPVTSPWSFALQGMDIVSPLLATVAHKKFLLVATSYFRKWVEAEAYTSIKDKDVSKFVQKNIVCRFGILQAIVANNGPQFDSIAFRIFCSELKIKNLYSMLRYPQSNGQIEATNKILFTELKKMLEKTKGKWVDELLGILWPYRTTLKRPTWTTPFDLTYGMEAIIPTEIGMPTAKIVVQGQMNENQEPERHLDQANEVRGNTTI